MKGTFKRLMLGALAGIVVTLLITLLLNGPERLNSVSETFIAMKLPMMFLRLGFIFLIWLSWNQLALFMYRGNPNQVEAFKERRSRLILMLLAVEFLLIQNVPEIIFDIFFRG